MRFNSSGICFISRGQFTVADLLFGSGVNKQCSVIGIDCVNEVKE